MALQKITAKKIIEKFNFDPKKTWFIGDTIHDFEVSQECGCKHVLISSGHQNYEKLKSKTDVVVEKLSDVKDFIHF